LADFLRLGTF